MKYLNIFFTFLIAGLQLPAQQSVQLQNNSGGHVSFVRYDEWGNYQFYPVSPGKTVEISFDNEYLNLFALEDDKDVPYFFFPGDEVSITGNEDKFYSFDSKDNERKNELALAQTLFRFFKNIPADIPTTDLLKKTRTSIDSLSRNMDLSKKTKELTQLYYLYDQLGKKIRYNKEKNVQESFENYWKGDYNRALQSYILGFRTYVLTYLPAFIKNEELVKEYARQFSGEYKEIALYSILHWSYYKDKAWFRSNYNEYLSQSKDKKYSERLAYFKLTDDLQSDAENMLVIGAGGDTSSVPSLLAKLKGNVVLIDLWASWCMPCIEQMPFSNELAAYFDKKPFRVLYLSLDREYHLFDRASKKHLPGKLNYNVVGNFDSPFAKMNKVKEIPRYMLIDKQGNFVTTKAPPPSDASLRELIQKYL